MPLSFAISTVRETPMKAVLIILLVALGGQLLTAYGQALPQPCCAAESLGPAHPAEETAATNASEAGPSEASGLEQVVVTAQKYSQPAFNVPISLVVIGQATLQRLRMTDMTQLQSYVPGLTVQEQDEGGLTINLRGISNTAGSGSEVGTYLDDADVTAPAAEGFNLMTYDLARVEVLRGPQGTLYGEGSVGGTIRYITNRPALDAVQMDADVAAHFIQSGAPGEQVVGIANAPLVEDKLALRVAVDYLRDGGWIDQPAAQRTNINSSHQEEVRLESRWAPTSQFTVDGTEVIHRGTFGLITGEDPPGYYTQNFRLTTTPRSETNENVSNLTLSWRPDGAQILNSTTYLTWYEPYWDTSFNEQLKAPPKPLLELYIPNAIQAAEDLNDELRVSNTDTGAWHWTIGTYYRHYVSHGGDLPVYVGLAGPLPAAALVLAGALTTSKSLSGFGDTSYRLFNRFTVGMGARYYTDDETSINNGVGQQQQKATFTSLDPRFYLRYTLSKHVNLYTSAAKGFRSGGFNSYGQSRYQPEHVWTYELGTKFILFGAGLTGDTDVFFTNYGNYQIVGVALSGPPIQITHNGGNVRVKGIEGNVSWSPVTSWHVGFSGDYIDGRFVSISVLSSQYAVGDPVDFMSRYQVTAFGEKDFLWGGKAAYARLDYSQRAPESYRNRSVGPWRYNTSDYFYQLNFHFGLQLNSAFKVGLFAQNLLNDRGYTEPEINELENMRQQPRTFGVEFHLGLD